MFCCRFLDHEDDDVSQNATGFGYTYLTVLKQVKQINSPLEADLRFNLCYSNLLAVAKLPLVIISITPNIVSTPDIAFHDFVLGKSYYTPPNNTTPVCVCVCVCVFVGGDCLQVLSSKPSLISKEILALSMRLYSSGACPVAVKNNPCKSNCLHKP